MNVSIITDKINQKLKSECRIKIANSGYIFGLEDSLSERSCTTSAKCASQEAVLFKIKSANFIQYLQKDQTAIDKISQYTDSKDINTINQIIKSNQTKITFNNGEVNKNEKEDDKCKIVNILNKNNMKVTQ